MSDPIDHTKLQGLLGYDFADQSWLDRALTHRSYSNEAGVEVDNQRMEFLGDAVLGLVVASRLFEHRRGSHEGELSSCLAQVVCQDALVDVARELQLGRFLRLGRGELLSGGRDKPSVLSDAYEAVLAAVFLDGGFDAARDVISRLHADAIAAAEPAEPPADYKSRLQIFAQGSLSTRPEYAIIESTGPPHAREFVAEVNVGGDAVASGRGRSKKQAEQAAAARALEILQARSSDSDD